MISDIINKKKHKYIDSDEEDAAPPVKKVQLAPIDPELYHYLFEADSSNPPPKEEKKKIIPEKKKQESNTANNHHSSNLDNLRYEILCRWWYCLDEWPPKDYDYESALRNHKLRKVDQATFKRDSELDEEGNRKVYEVSGYKGVFRTSQGDTLDLRPKEGCPSYENISTLSAKSLPKLYLKGLKAQLKDLMTYEPNNLMLKQHLNGLIEQCQKQYRKYLE